jgi:hypothetical protein
VAEFLTTKWAATDERPFDVGKSLTCGRHACELRSLASAAPAPARAAPAASGINGVHTSLLKKLLFEFGISVQRYWSGQLVGQDCRKFLKAFAQILTLLRDEIAKNHGAEKAQRFYDRHFSVLKDLALCFINFLIFVLVSTPVLTASTCVVAWPQGDQFLGGDL